MAATAPPSTAPISHAIVYSGPIAAPQTHGLRGQLSFLNQPSQPHQGITHLPAKGLLLVLSSHGGSTFEMRSLYGLIRSLSYPVEIHLVGQAKSAAVPLMLAADRRTAAPDTTFLFHPWTWGMEPHPGHTAEGLLQFPLQLEDDVSWGKAVFQQRTSLTKSEIEVLFEKPHVEDVHFGLKNGLIHLRSVKYHTES